MTLAVCIRCIAIVYGIIYACGLAVAVYGAGLRTRRNICLGKVLKVLKLMNDKRGGTIVVVVVVTKIVVCGYCPSGIAFI